MAHDSGLDDETLAGGTPDDEPVTDLELVMHHIARLGETERNDLVIELLKDKHDDATDEDWLKWLDWLAEWNRIRPKQEE